MVIHPPRGAASCVHGGFSKRDPKLIFMLHLHSLPFLNSFKVSPRCKFGWDIPTAVKMCGVLMKILSSAYKL